MLQEAVRESPCRSPGVDSHATRNIKSECFEGCLELFAAPADKTGFFANIECCVLLETHARLVEFTAVRIVHMARLDEPTRLRTRDTQ